MDASASSETRIGYVASDLGGQDPQSVVEMLAELGYRAVDWTMEQFDPLSAPASALVDLVRAANGTGLETPQLMVHQDFVVADEEMWERRVRRAELAVEACAEASVPTIGVLTGPNMWEAGHTRVGVDISEGRAWDLALRALERILVRADATGVLVALEPCWGTLARDRYRAEYAIARLEGSALRINFDPSHFVLSGDDIAATAASWASRIAHVHLKDAFGVAGTEGEDFIFLLPGEGAVPWPELFAALDAGGYAGPMSIENEAFLLLNGPLAGDIRRSAALARELAGGLLAAARSDPLTAA
jgi:sugar phosphate isomerase/epimerase